MDSVKVGDEVEYIDGQVIDDGPYIVERIDGERAYYENDKGFDHLQYIKTKANFTNPKDALGIAKPGFHYIPPAALLQLGRAMVDGRNKYGLMNWRDKKVKASVYYDAALRHKLSWWDGETLAPDSLVHHLAHDMACNAILLDAIATGNLIDDRPTPGTFSELVQLYTKKD